MDIYPVPDETWKTAAGRMFDVICVGNSRVFIRWQDNQKEDTLPLEFFNPELGILELV